MTDPAPHRSRISRLFQRWSRSSRRAVVLALVAAALMVTAALAAGTGTDLISNTRSADPYGLDYSDYANTSNDGRFVVFSSREEFPVNETTTWLTHNGADCASSTNCYYQVFLYDRQEDDYYLISRDVNYYPSVREPTGSSRYPVISADGRYVAFQSDSAKLIPGDTLGKTDIFIFDNACISSEYQTYFNSLGYSEGINCPIWDGGKSTALISSKDGFVSAFGNDNSGTPPDTSEYQYPPYPRIGIHLYTPDPTHPECRYPAVVFESAASDLVGVGGDTNGVKDIFIRYIKDPIRDKDASCTNLDEDKDYGKTHQNWTVRLTRGTGGASSNPVVSQDGKWFAYASFATDLVSGDTNGTSDVFLMASDMSDGWAATTRTMISRIPSGGEIGNGYSSFPSISADGGLVAFQSLADNLDDDDTPPNYADIFLYDRVGKTLQVISMNSDEERANGNSFTPAVAPDGKSVAFTSYGDNLVVGDNNLDCRGIVNEHEVDINCPDVFVRDLEHGVTWRSSITADGLQSHAASAMARMTEDGKYLFFVSWAKLLEGGNGVPIDDEIQQVYVRDQGAPPGNPIISPSSWIFYSAPLMGTSRTFRLEFLADLEIAGDPTLTECEASTDPPYNCALQPDGAGIFEIKSNTCTADTYHITETCQMLISYTPATSSDHHRGLIEIPLNNDDRIKLQIGLEGFGKELRMFPLVIQESQ